jgi:shikimate dehydrogenase
MQISGKTRVFMVLADPVAQVQAPQLYNRLFQLHGVDAVLVPAQVKAADFEAFVRHTLTAHNIDGLWLTIPHKPAMAAMVDRCDRLGGIAQSVNAARRNADGSLEGALFDGTGFVKALHHFGFDPAGKRVLLVGVGGAGVAIAASLADAGVGHLALVDASQQRARSVAARLAEHTGATLSAPASADPAGFDLAINATPLGLQTTDPLPFDVSRLEAHALVIDILMKPYATPLLKACAARGITAHPGFEMLAQQVPDYLNFFGLHDAARAVQADLAPVRALLQPE